MNVGSGLRISLHTGALFRHDAVSASMVAKLDAIDQLRRRGAAIEGKALVSFTEVDRPDVILAPGACGALDQSWFWSADVRVYEFGIWYEAFDTVFVAPDDSATIAVYHNVTPPGLASDPGLRRLLERSCGKKANLHRFDHVICISAFSRDELLGLGFDGLRLSVVPLPPSVTVSPKARRRPEPTEPVQLLYVGRFVSAKGVLDLLHAVRLALDLGCNRFRLNLAGNERLSAPGVLEDVRRLVATPELAGVVRMVGEVEDSEMAALYARADALVMPSHHEGYCVPVVEAISAGAHVISSDAGNLPNIVGGVGRTVAVGDVSAMAAAITELVDNLGRTRRGEPMKVATDEGVLDGAAWQERVNDHRRRHSLTAFRKGFWTAVSTAIARRGGEPPEWLETSV